MRRFIPIAVAGLALVLAAPASTATSTVQIKSTGFVPATVTINQDDAVTWTNTDTTESPGRGERRLVCLADPGAGQELHPRLQRRGDVPLPRRPPSQPEGHGHGPGRAAGRSRWRVSAPVREVRDAGDAHRRGEQQANGRDGHDRRRCPSGRRHQAGRRDAADHERRRVLLQRHARGSTRRTRRSGKAAESSVGVQVQP